jgi:phosphatidylserine decarboxylase
MTDIVYIDRNSKKEEKELIYGKIFLQLLYGKGLFSRVTALFFRPLFTRVHFLSKLYGAFQKSRFSRSKVVPFIETFKIDASEFLEPPASFASFNDFFIRKLKPSARPMAPGNGVAVMPADGRYLVYDNFDAADGIVVKGKKFSLEELVQSPALAKKYHRGGIAIARLCPVDYHRFHFPCDGKPEKPQLINGTLFSVNPIALKHNIDIFTENKRVITPFHTSHFGTILYIEIGATYVGSIHQTFDPASPQKKGNEKGYFEFGGSCLVLLFEPNTITFDQDLLDASRRHIEVRARLGQSLGRSMNDE